MAKKFTNLMKTINPQIQEAQQTVSRINRENYTKVLIIKLLKTSEKEKILKAPREKKDVIYRGTKIRFSNDFSLKTMQTRRKWAST